MSLPYVPLPHTDEWLGFWLHRIAAVYGMNLGRLLGELNCLRDTSWRPTWGQMRTLSSVELSDLAEMLRESPSALAAMQHLISPRVPSAQVGCCARCLGEGSLIDAPLYWRRSWMDPYQGWCDRHWITLMPIDSAEFRFLASWPRTEAVLKSLRRDAVNYPSSYIKDLADDEIQSLKSLTAALHNEREQTPGATVKPLRQLVDAIAIRAIGTASERRLACKRIGGLDIGSPVLCRQRLTGGYLSTMKSLTQRTEVVRFAARVLWPDHRGHSIRDLFWQTLSTGNRDWLALWLSAANAAAPIIDWPEAQDHAEAIVQRDNESELGFCFRV